MSYAQKKINSWKKIRWTGRGVIVVAFAFSTWANILHVAHPGIVTYAIAAAPPVVVFLGWELVSRVPISGHRFRKGLRPTVTALIAAGAAWLSYWHQKAAILRYEDDPQTAYILPLLIDGLMVIASATVYELNTLISNMEATVAAGTAKTKQKEDAPVKVRKQELTAREKVVIAAKDNPNLTVKQIASLVQAKENYVRNILGQLKKEAQRDQAAEPAAA